MFGVRNQYSGIKGASATRSVRMNNHNDVNDAAAKIRMAGEVQPQL
jgi:hypothetical protein